MFTEKIEKDGNARRTGAEFLIDQHGIIQIAHYQKYAGDELSVTRLIDAVKL